MRPTVLVVMISSAALAPAGSTRAAEAALFQFEQQAKQHCPGDTIVWLSRASGTYSFAGERWYGSTKNGAFVCRREGDLAGYRPNRAPSQAPPPPARPSQARPPVTQAALPSASE